MPHPLALAGWFGTGAWLLASAVARRTARLRTSVVNGFEFITDHARSRRNLEFLAGQIESVERELGATLGVPPIPGTLRIFVFARQSAFSQHVRQHIPSVRRADSARRHGLFLLRRRVPYIFLVEGDGLVTSLRHETAHAALNASHPRLPLWIDEGLAQCFESGSGDHWNDRSAGLLEHAFVRRRNLHSRSLESLSVMRQMGPSEYAGCWAHIYQLLRSEFGREALRTYLGDLRDGRTPATLSDALATIAHRVAPANVAA